MPRAITTIDPVDQYVGERLRAERHRRGLTQTQLGAAIGVAFQQVQKYERGLNRISASMLARAARTLGVAVADFFPSDADPASSGERLEIGDLRGGPALIRSFAAMGPAQRALLVQIAEQFARSPTPTAGE